MYRRILVPLDGSELAETALDYARDIVGRLNLSMTVLHVYDSAEQEFITMREGYIAGIVDLVRHQLSEQFGRGHGLPEEVQGKLAMGHAAEEIIHYADKNDIDLILMATHGRSGIKRWAIGSIADKVVRATKKPVILIRAAKAAPPQNVIIVPLDGFKQSEAVVGYIESLASGLKSDVVLLRVLEEYYEIDTRRGMTRVRYTNARMEQLKEEANRYLDKIATPLRDSGITVKSEVRIGEIAREIIKLADEENARMVAMLKRRRSSISPLDLGSVADKVLRRGTTPVLLFSTSGSSQKR